MFDSMPRAVDVGHESQVHRGHLVRLHVRRRRRRTL